ncbi:type II CRISPR-associated endonuclease Cas1 [Lacticaseibacillus mingshuiensis]|uniref:CRISPR-associated endonuclease Cas1 n=1 Tax=Lacticaseibacillus mingshuiensis TaxID=2799574 RepID=A0ABW4CF13_9LACO|nr:type II CRISPR-associated endonuclease Cas1 [Lacticaseibacillus mingshuiensis]
MNFRTIYVTSHAKVTTLSNNLVVQTDNGTKTIPLEDVHLLVLGTPQVTVSGMAISALARTGAKVLFTGPNGKLSAETMNMYSTGRSASTIVSQVLWDVELMSVVWTKIIGAKLSMQVQVLEAMQKNASLVRMPLEEMELNDVTNREAVAARKYFPELFGSGFSRSNIDATNAALNYGYQILLSHVNLEITVNGYMTELGIHHQSEENQFNLGSDLMEPFRPFIDLWVSRQKFKELTPDVKVGLLDNMNTVIKYNGKNTLLRNAIPDHVNRCLRFLNGSLDELQMEVRLADEVSSDETNGDV